MPFSFLGKKSTEKRDKEQAKEDYELACSVTLNDRVSRQFKTRMALRSRAHLDKCFIEGAEQTERFEALLKLNELEGKPKPSLPTVSEFQQVPTVNGQAFTYLPKDISERAFKLGMQYQSMALTPKQAVEAMQNLANQISLEMRLVEPFEALVFLREEFNLPRLRSGTPPPEDSSDHHDNDKSEA